MLNKNVSRMLVEK